MLVDKASAYLIKPPFKWSQPEPDKYRADPNLIQTGWTALFN